MALSQAPLATASAPAAPARWRWSALLCCLPIGFLWFVLIDHLRIEWRVNAQYNYGWAVPGLCAYLAWCARRDGKTAPLGSGLALLLSRASVALVMVLALLYLPTRLVQEANPEWRFVSWALALIVVGLTCVFVLRVGGPVAWRRYAFPILFFLVAVPWPTLIEGPLIQRLTLFNAAGAVELLNVLGIPALRHGNVIEISAGWVGVEDACSGIRSFQACLMIGLFLGAFYRLRPQRRLALVALGFLLAILFNLGRTVLLVTVASRQGLPAIAQWHDPAGVTILVGCFFGVWLLAGALARRQPAPALPPADPAVPPDAGNCRPTPLPVVLAVGLGLWLGLCEAGVASWYARHEASAEARVTWQIRLPKDAAEFQEVAFSEQAVQLLRFDEGLNGRWLDAAGTRWQAIFLRWNPGRVAARLARSHTPEVCLTAAGRKVSAAPTSRVVQLRDVTLTFDAYEVKSEGLTVYYCLWEDRDRGESSATTALTYHNRFRPVLEGRRNRGQRSLEIAVWSRASAEEVHAQMTAMLQSLVEVAAPLPADRSAR